MTIVVYPSNEVRYGNCLSCKDIEFFQRFNIPLKRFGDPNKGTMLTFGEDTIQVFPTEFAGEICSYEGCNDKAGNCGYCKYHKKLIYRHKYTANNISRSL